MRRVLFLFVLLGCGSTTNVEPDGAVDATTTIEAAAESGTMDAEAGMVGCPKLPAGRPMAVACSMAPRPAGNAGLDGGTDGGDCILDTTCNANASGRCNDLVASPWYGGKSLGTRCTYNGCYADNECEAGVCGCAIGFAGQHLCLGRSNCRVNADCPNGNVCAPSTVAVYESPGVVVTGNEIATSANNDGTLGYFCTTSKDECCPGAHGDAGTTNLVCVFSTPKQRWVWAGLP